MWGLAYQGLAYQEYIKPGTAVGSVLVAVPLAVGERPALFPLTCFVP